MPTEPHAHKPNRLGGQTSPYLLQHRLNPVDWYPWGDEAFAEARRRNVPIFLSIGYSTCYWCHVMERESFENERIAALLNDAFICIKVDREERPDVDDVYMAAVQAFSGRGGWPMSVFLEPYTLKPFWAGTYFPPEEKPGYGVPSLPRIIDGISAAWRDGRDEVVAQANELAAAVTERIAEIGDPAQLSREHVSSAVGRLLRMHDRRYGGFGGENGESVGPKFPHPVYLDLLLTTRAAAGDDATRNAIDLALRSTLDAMALGGIHDHLAGGFHRYSVDAKWLVPHFEKMLYDNALLLTTYARAAIVYNEPFYRFVAERTAGYILSELTCRESPTSTHPKGQPIAFYSAQDAEVDHREGLNYLWSPEEFRAILYPEDSAFAEQIYGLSQGPNFRDPHHPHDPPRNVLFLSARPALTDHAKLDPRVERINTVLLRARAQRKQPARDDKAITSWNALAIAALAEAGHLLDKPDWIAAAAAVAETLLTRLRLPDGRLARTLLASRESLTAGAAPNISALFEDHAALLGALAHLARADAPRRDQWLAHARTLLNETERTFADRASATPADDPADLPSIFFDTPPLAARADLFVRPRTVYDGAIPSPIGQHLHALIDLHALTQNPLLHDRAVAALRAISGYVARAPLGAANSTRALLRLLQTDTGAVREALLAAPVLTLDLDHMRNPDDIVEILAAHERIAISADHAALLPLRLRIKPGHHLNAAIPIPSAPDSSAPTLIPFRISVINGTGVRAFVDYPEGDPAGMHNELRTYAGEIDLTVVLECEGEWSGQPLLSVRYQVCTDTECFAPTTVELDVALDRG